MMRGVEKNHRISDRKYRKVLNLKDPFDRLIMELSSNGVLDVGVVGIHPGKKPHLSTTYSRRPGSPRRGYTE